MVACCHPCRRQDRADADISFHRCCSNGSEFIRMCVVLLCGGRPREGDVRHRVPHFRRARRNVEVRCPYVDMMVAEELDVASKHNRETLEAMLQLQLPLCMVCGSTCKRRSIARCRGEKGFVVIRAAPLPLMAEHRQARYIKQAHAANLQLAVVIQLFMTCVQHHVAMPIEHPATLPAHHELGAASTWRFAPHRVGQ